MRMMKNSLDLIREMTFMKVWKRIKNLVKRYLLNSQVNITNI